MGKPMGFNLIKTGFPFHFFARNTDTIKLFKNAGAISHHSPKEVAEHVDILITMLPATHDVEEILLGKQGVIHGLKPGGIVIDMSTIAANATVRFAQALAKKEIEMLDAPVSGGEQGAIAGTLSIMVGGKETILKKTRPVLEALGKNIVHIGDHGAGQVAKACNQVIIAETIVAVSEALRLAKASGVEPVKVREALLGGFAHSRVLDIHGQRMLDHDYKPGFKASLHRKDMHLALEQAHLAGVTLTSAHFAMQYLDRLVLKGHSDLDSSAIHLVLAEE